MSGIKYRVSPRHFLFGIACVFVCLGSSSRLLRAFCYAVAASYATLYPANSSAPCIKISAFNIDGYCNSLTGCISIFEFCDVYGRRQLLFGVDHPKEHALLILFFLYILGAGVASLGNFLCLGYIFALTDIRAVAWIYGVSFLYQFGFRNALSLGAYLFWR